jgi:hypothetical protein
MPQDETGPQEHTGDHTSDHTGAREASIAAWCFGLLFLSMLGLLAIADAGDQAAVATTMASVNLAEIR